MASLGNPWADSFLSRREGDCPACLQTSAFVPQSTQLYKDPKQMCTDYNKWLCVQLACCEFVKYLSVGPLYCKQIQPFSHTPCPQHECPTQRQRARHVEDTFRSPLCVFSPPPNPMIPKRSLCMRLFVTYF